jgi:hypothetical protein
MWVSQLIDQGAAFCVASAPTVSSRVSFKDLP